MERSLCVFGGICFCVLFLYTPATVRVWIQEGSPNQNEKATWISDLAKDFHVPINKTFKRKYHPNLPTQISGLSAYEVSVEGIYQLLETEPILRASLTKVQEFRCTTVKTENKFRICSHGNSGLFTPVANGMVWEIGLLKLAEDAMNMYGDNAIFLDIGANIGTHSLYHLNNGRFVVAIDAMRDNVLDILLGALVQPKEEASKRLALFHGGVSSIAEILIPFKNNNNGMTRFTTVNESKTFNDIFGMTIDLTDTVSTTTVAEIVRAIPGNQTIIMKVDIEGSECKAFADASMLKLPDRFIPYIIMEFEIMNVFASLPNNSMCTKAKVKKVIDNFYNNGYQLLNLAGRKVDAKNGEKTPYDAVWVHEKALPIKFKPEYGVKLARRR